MYENFNQPRTAASTNSYASINKVSNLNSKTVTVQFKENDVNAVQYQILASLDDVTYVTLVADVDVAKNGSEYEIVEGGWRFIDAQIKSAVAATHGNVTCTISGV